MFSGYLFIVGGYYSDESLSTHGVKEAEVVDIGSDIEEGCGLRMPYAENFDGKNGSLYSFQFGGDMLGDFPVLCGGYCK